SRPMTVYSPLANRAAPVAASNASVMIVQTTTACAPASPSSAALPPPTLCEQTTSSLPSASRTATSTPVTPLPWGAENSTVTPIWPEMLAGLAWLPFGRVIDWITISPAIRSTVTAAEPTADGFSADVARLSVLPSPTPVTRPVLLTEATPSSSDDHVTLWFDVPETWATSCRVPPMPSSNSPGVTVTWIAGGGLTVTVAWPFAVGSAAAVAMITAVPAL